MLTALQASQKHTNKGHKGVRKEDNLPTIYECEEEEEVGSLRRSESIKSPSSLRADSLPNMNPYLKTQTSRNIYLG